MRSSIVLNFIEYVETRFSPLVCVMYFSVNKLFHNDVGAM